MAAIIGLLVPMALIPHLAVSQGSAMTAMATLLPLALVGMLWIAAALSLWTGWRYMLAAARSTNR
jgi:CDP-diacylglycerol--glycerol-3-phosphate 3-phosphatidyltransferase